MLSAAECLAKADRLQRIALLCPTQALGDEYLNMALGWRQLAALADRQEAWDAIHPGG
jgi:hypothetical protein